jgi:hypothetical protein
MKEATQAHPVCEPRCPDFSEWDDNALTLGVCPRCGRGGFDDAKLARVLWARAWAEESVRQSCGSYFWWGGAL